MSSQEEEGFSWGSFLSGPLPGKLAALIGLIVVSRVGVYVRIPGVDVDAFSTAMQSNGLLGYVDALSGGSISKVSLQEPALSLLQLYVCRMWLYVWQHQQGEPAGTCRDVLQL
jgi:hypothetical protein